MDDGGSARRARFEEVAAVVFEPLQRYLARRCTPADAGDVLGDAMLVVWRRIDAVPTDDPLPWCYGVARRCLMNQRRSAQRRLRLAERLEHRAGGQVAFGPGEIDDATDPALAAALEHLSEGEREMVRLWAWERLEPREIATVLETTPNAVSVALSRAKRKLRSALDRQDPARAGQIRVGGDDSTVGGEQERSGR